MKNAKRLASIVLAIVMVLVMAIPAFAVEPTGKITVTNALYNKTYTIYRMLELESYDKNSGAYSYKVTTAWKDFFTTFTADNGTVKNDAAENYVTVTEDSKGNCYVTWKTGADAAAFAKLAQKYAKNLAANEGQQKVEKADAGIDDTTRIEFTGLDLGYYLLDTDLGTICSLNTTDLEVEVTEKNDDPANAKLVEENGTFGAQNDADIGDTVRFQSTITAQAGAESYTFHDKMCDALNYVGIESIKLNDVDLVDKATVAADAAYDYEVAHPATCTEGCTFGVVFSDALCDRLQDNDKIVITYTATLKENATIAGTGNKNESRITYGQDGKFKTVWSETHTFTWKFDAFKYTLDKNDNTTKNPLAGAVFTLSTSNDGSNPIEFVKDTSKDNGVVVGYRVAVAADTDKITEIETNADGKFSLNGLDSGTYYLTEKTAPTGYNKLDKPVEIKIANDGTVTVKGDEGTFEPVGANGVEIENNTGSRLPETGGIGTTIFYVVGSLLLVGAVVLLIAKKRMSAER